MNIDSPSIYLDANNFIPDTLNKSNNENIEPSINNKQISKVEANKNGRL